MQRIFVSGIPNTKAVMSSRITCGACELIQTVYVPVPAPKDPKRDRHEPLPGDSKDIAAWRTRMKTDEAKEIYQERASTIECVNAQARNRGLIRLLVRGLEKVKAIALWYAIAHNVRRGFSLRGGLETAG